MTIFHHYLKKKKKPLIIKKKSNNLLVSEVSDFCYILNVVQNQELRIKFYSD